MVQECRVLPFKYETEDSADVLSVPRQRKDLDMPRRNTSTDHVSYSSSTPGSVQKSSL